MTTISKEILLRIQTLTKQMLAMCHKKDWTTLASYENERATIIHAAKNNPPIEDSEKDKDEAITLLEDITKMNKEIHVITSTQMDDDKKNLLSFKKAKKAQQYYQNS
jgi:hypothetical protein